MTDSTDPSTDPSEDKPATGSLQGATFYGCSLNKTIFSGTDMTDATFTKCDGEESVFDENLMSGTAFDRNRFRDLKGGNNEVIGATFTANDWDEISRWTLGGPYEQGNADVTD